VTSLAIYPRFADLREHLAELQRRQRYRHLSPRCGRDFSSNDYLGLAESDALRSAVAEALERGVPVGSGGSRLLRGNHPEHEALEAEAATYFGAAAALFFSSGYAANATLLSTLPQAGDLILHDELVHASSHEGMRLARAPSLGALHNDPQSFRDQLRNWRASGGKGRPWIVVESVYSMDGDKAPLGELIALADEFDGVLIVDEAHATGVFGDGGRGLATAIAGRDNVVAVRTCGKALGCEGALVCGPQVVRDFLINRGRGFIFSTAPSPLMASAVRSAISILREQPERQRQLHQLFAFAATHLEPLGASFHGTQILPLIVADSAKAVELAARVQKAGFDVRAIRPPTVPEGTSRLRLSITLNVDEQAVGALAKALADARQ
jgi:8-amino-7-oxononanoate synthase